MFSAYKVGLGAVSVQQTGASRGLVGANGANTLADAFDKAAGPSLTRRIEAWGAKYSKPILIVALLGMLGGS